MIQTLDGIARYFYKPTNIVIHRHTRHPEFAGATL
jgi:hypothetical protein